MPRSSPSLSHEAQWPSNSCTLFGPEHGGITIDPLGSAVRACLSGHLEIGVTGASNIGSEPRAADRSGHHPDVRQNAGIYVSRYIR